MIHFIVRRKVGGKIKEMTWQKRKIWVIVTALTAAIVLVLFSGYYLYSEVHTERQVDYSVYQYHIAIISEEKNSSFWKDICSGAAEKEVMLVTA